jgi:hypothetical protein
MLIVCLDPGLKSGKERMADFQRRQMHGAGTTIKVGEAETGNAGEQPVKE